MPTLNKLPWVSLALLLVTYSSLGWLISAFSDSWLVWVITIVGILLIARAVTSPWSKIRDSFASLFVSDSRAFLFAVSLAFFTVIIISWLHLFVQALVIFSSGILARLDTQKAGLSEGQTFWTLLIVASVGLGLGAVAQTLIGVRD